MNTNSSNIRALLIYRLWTRRSELPSLLHELMNIVDCFTESLPPRNYRILQICTRNSKIQTNPWRKVMYVRTV